MQITLANADKLGHSHPNRKILDLVPLSLHVMLDVTPVASPLPGGGVASPPIQLLEENARANPDARIRPLTHVSVDRAYQAKSIGRNSLVTILIAIRRSPNL